MKRKFNGYLRKDGLVGVRNYVAVIPTVGCVNEVALRIARQVNGAMPILHHQGCCQLATDLSVVKRVLVRLSKNPNVSATLLVSLGCESIKAEEVREEVKSDKPVEIVNLQEIGGVTKAVSQGILMAQKMAFDSSSNERKEFDLSNLTIGIKCGASDTTSGIASNPATGVVADKLVDMGAKVIFGETTEVMGAEHILARRGSTEEVGNAILRKVNEMEERARSMGVDMRGGQPTGGNIKGGLSTIEEKSLGAIVKGGTRQIQGVLEYGGIPSQAGLYFMDSPGREMEFLTGVASAGCQIILFSTGLGAPQGFPISPVIKISGNQKTCERLAEHIDVDVSAIIRGEEDIEKAGGRIVDELLKVASGKKVKAELLNYDSSGVNCNIYATGPVI